MGNIVEIARYINTFVGTAAAGAVNGSIRIYHPGALLKNTVKQAAIRRCPGGSAGHQSAFHIIWRQVCIELQHQGDHAAGQCCSLGRAGHLVELVAVMEFRMHAGQNGVVLHKAYHMAARCNQIGLDEPFIGRPGGRKGCQIIISDIVRRVVVRHCTDGNDIRHIAGYTDRHGARTGVACRRYYHDAGLKCCHNCLVEGVIPIIGSDRSTQGKIQHPDSVYVLVGDHEINGRYHLDVGTEPISVKCLYHNDTGIRCYSVVRPGQVAIDVWSWLAAGHYAGQMGTMSILVLCGRTSCV